MKIGCTPSELGEPGEEKIREAYLRYVNEYGGEAVCLEPVYTEEAVAELLTQYDGFLLTGGQDVDPSRYGAERRPECEESSAIRDEFELLLARACLKQGKPLFGICRGLQLLNVAAGGTLIQDIPSEVATGIVHPQKDGSVRYAHSVTAVRDSGFGALLGAEPFMVNSFHHQAVKEIAPGFRASVFAEDGIIEAIESLSCPQIKAVQWHPERMEYGERISRALMEDFLTGCRK